MPLKLSIVFSIIKVSNGKEVRVDDTSKPAEKIVEEAGLDIFCCLENFLSRCKNLR